MASNNKYTVKFPYVIWGNVGYYEADVNITAVRTNGSNTVDITATCSRVTQGGDVYSWNLGIGETNSYSASKKTKFAEETNAGNVKHFQYGSYSVTAKTSFNVGATAGTKTIYLFFEVNGSSQYVSVNVSYSDLGACAINSITTVGGNTTIHLADIIAIKWTPNNRTDKFKVRLLMGSESLYLSDWIEPNRTTEYSYNDIFLNFPKMQEAFKNTVKATFRIQLYTFNSSEVKLGSTTKDFEVSLATHLYTPVLSVEVGGKDSAFNTFLTGTSRAVFNCEISTVGNATIAGLEVEYGGTLYTPTVDKTISEAQIVTVTSVVIPANIAEWQKAKITLTDSRGLKTTQTVNVTPIATYTAPKISNMRVTLNGANITVSAAYKFTNLSGNTYQFRITRTPVAGGAEVDMVPWTNLTSASGNLSQTVTVDDADTVTYNVKLYLKDKKGTVNQVISTGVVTFSALGGGKGIALFKEATREGLDVNGRVYADEYFVGDTKLGSALYSNPNAVSIPSGTRTIVTSYTLPPGVYAIQYMCLFAMNGAGFRSVYISTSGQADAGEGIAARSNSPAVSGENTYVHCFYMREVTRETTFYFVAYQNSGGSLDVTARLRIFRIG